MGIICGCLPIIRVFCRQLAPTNSTWRSKYSCYFRLEKLNRSPPLIGTARNIGATAEYPDILGLTQAASIQEYPPRKLEVSVLGGSDTHNKERVWDGTGILKTVDMEQSGVEVPKKAHLLMVSGVPRVED